MTVVVSNVSNRATTVAYLVRFLLCPVFSKHYLTFLLWQPVTTKDTVPTGRSQHESREFQSRAIRSAVYSAEHWESHEYVYRFSILHKAVATFFCSSHDCMRFHFLPRFFLLNFYTYFRLAASIICPSVQISAAVSRTKGRNAEWYLKFTELVILLWN